MLVTHQDNGLVFDDAGAPGLDWYRRLADRVVGDLVAAGFPESEGGHTARRLLGSRSGWVERLGACIDAPRLYDAGLYFDFRRLGGALDLAPLEHAVSRAGREPLFLRFLAREALEFQPPPALRLRLGGDGSVVDLKRHGLFPVVFLARCYGLEVDSRARATLSRLEAARAAGLLGDQAHARVPGAFRFLLGLRLRLQLRDLLAGRPGTSEARMRELAPLERTRLKEAFRVIRTWQEGAAYHFQTRFL
jgi:CBS domain-containing protein